MNIAASKTMGIAERLPLAAQLIVLGAPPSCAFAGVHGRRFRNLSIGGRLCDIAIMTNLL